MNSLTLYNMEKIIHKIDWKKADWLLPVIIQNYLTSNVLMLGYMSQEALERTVSEKQVTFFSRTKQRLWKKWETSWNFLNVEEMFLDCDYDTLLIKVRPEWPTCHTGSESCFSKENESKPFLEYIQDVIDKRRSDDNPNSYVQKCFQKWHEKIAQKVWEEWVEVTIASVKRHKGEIVYETADLLFHILLNLREHDLKLQDIIQELRLRHKK